MKLFSRAVKPNFTISKDFYLTIFCPSAAMPTLRDVIAHRRMTRAVVGMGAPLLNIESDDPVGEPLRPGAYACVTMNRKTVVRMLVMRKDDCQVDIQAISSGKDRLGLDADSMVRIKEAWFLVQLSFESFDPQAFSSIRFMYRIADRVADLTDGIIADPLAERYVKPGTWYKEAHDEAPLDPLELVTISAEETPGGLRLLTAGMRKIELPEYAVELTSSEHSPHGHEVIVESVRDLLHQKRKGGHPSHAAVLHPFKAAPHPNCPDILVIRPHDPRLEFLVAHQEWKSSRELYN